VITRLIGEKALLAAVARKGREDLVINWPEIMKKVEGYYIEYIDLRQLQKKE
jgi:hypothetical protein